MATRGVMTIATVRASVSGKMFVVFDSEYCQIICVNVERFNNEIGFIMHNHGTFASKEWKVVPPKVRAPLREYLLVSYKKRLLYFLFIYSFDNDTNLF